MPEQVNQNPGADQGDESIQWICAVICFTFSMQVGLHQANSFSSLTPLTGQVTP
jgi:hypothetical protein